jgi:hypothetical protein
MPNALTRPGSGVIPGLVMLLGGCAAAPSQAPIELNVTLRESGSCCVAASLVNCHERTAAIKAAYEDPDRLHHTVPELGFSRLDRPGTVAGDLAGWVEHDLAGWVEHDLAGWVEHDLAGWVEHDLAGWVERDLAGWVERDRGDTLGHDLLRCAFRNQQLLAALRACHQKLNLCRSDNESGCNDAYTACYIQAVQAGPFDQP